MPIRDSHPAGTPSWVDLATTDPGAAKQFYGGLFGWQFEDMPMGDEGVYSMAMLGGRAAAAIAPQQPEQAGAGVPPHWQLYITVDDVEDATTRVEPAGGTVHMGPFDVFDAGRMSVIQDPVGAFVCLWQPKASIGAEVVNEPGAFTWEELVAPAAASAAPFYEAVVGLHLVDVDMGGDVYHGFSLDGTTDTMVGGTMEPPAPGIPPHWMIYFGTADVDAAAASVAELGGTVTVPPFDIPVGRMAVVADPQGAAFCLFEIPAAGASTES